MNTTNKTNYNLIIENIITGNKDIICSSTSKNTILCKQKMAEALLDLKYENAKKCANCLASRNKCYYTKNDAESALQNIKCKLKTNLKDLKILSNKDEWYIDCPEYLDLVNLQSIQYKIEN